MKLYSISKNHDLEITGHYPQTTENFKRPFDHMDLRQKFRGDKFPDYVPKRGFDLHPEAKATDILEFIGFDGLVISEKLKGLLREIELPPHRFYPIEVSGTKQNYFWFHFINSIWDHVDYTQTEMAIVHKFKFTLEYTQKFSSISDIMQFESDLPRHHIINVGELALYDSFPNYGIFQVTGPSFFTVISEKFRDLMVSEDISGIEMKKYSRIKLSGNSKPVATSKPFVVEYSEFKLILDKIQIASANRSGENDLRELINRINSDTVLIKVNWVEHKITNETELQNLIDKYDQNIRVSEIK